MRIALYARVSTSDQTVGQQLDDLRQICSRQGWNVVAELQDTISGTKFTRKGLDELMAMVRRKRIDLIACHKLDRLGRSLPHLAQMIGEFESHGVALFIPGQGIDTRDNNPAGKLQMHVLMAVADFERSLISSRTKLKLQALQRSGRHIGRPKMLASVKARAVTLMESYSKTGINPTCRRIARELGVSVGTAHRLRADMAAFMETTSPPPITLMKCVA